MGTPAFAGEALRGVLESGHDVVCVVSQPDRPVGRGRKMRSPAVALIAKEAGIPLLQPQSVGKKAFREELRTYAPDVAVVAAYGQIFGPKLLSLPRLGCINIHASLLPRWRGAAPIQAAILSGDKTTGVTIMQMGLGLDEGPMLVSETTSISSTDTAESLHDRLALMGRQIIGPALDGLESGRWTPEEQPADGVTYCPKLTKADGKLDFSDSALDLERRVRSLHPWPGTFTFFQGERLKIYPPVVAVLDGIPEGRPGEIVKVTGESILVHAGEGGLELWKVQRPGRPAVDTKSFLAGHRVTEGTILGEES